MWCVQDTHRVSVLSLGPVSGSRYMARLRVTGADCGTGHKNNMTIWMDDNCSFRLMNTRKYLVLSLSYL